MRTLLILLAVSLAAHTAHAQAPGLTMSFDPGPPQAPMSAEDADLLETGEIGPGKWLLGVGVATGMGFGMGQTVQGRWRETGWIFTVGESLSLTALVLTIPALFSGDCYDCSQREHSESNRAAYIAIGSLIAYAGFHVWEIGDALIAPVAFNHRYHAALARHPEATQLAVTPFLVPSDRGSGGVAGVALRF
ncbi:MAG: hypothetical protein ABI591_08495 [Kofleriaceae bacterium]